MCVCVCVYVCVCVCECMYVCGCGWVCYRQLIYRCKFHKFTVVFHIWESYPPLALKGYAFYGVISKE